MSVKYCSFQFSPTVKSDLNNKLLSPNCRNEFTRDIGSAMRVHTLLKDRTKKIKPSDVPPFPDGARVLWSAILHMRRIA